MDYNSLYDKFVYIRGYFVDVRTLKYVLDRTSNLKQKKILTKWKLETPISHN
jgi:hypothetical protein